MRVAFFVGACLALSGCAGAAANAGALHTGTDPESGATSVTLEALPVEGSAVGVEFAVTLVGVAGTPTVSFQLESRSASGWRYRQCYGLNFVADGQPIAREASTQEGELLRGGGTRELITTRLSLQGIRTLASATESVGRVCQNEFRFSAEARQRLAAFVAEVERVTAAAEAEAAQAAAAAEAAAEADAQAAAAEATTETSPSTTAPAAP